MTDGMQNIPLRYEKVSTMTLLDVIDRDISIHHDTNTNCDISIPLLYHWITPSSAPSPSPAEEEKKKVFAHLSIRGREDNFIQMIRIIFGFSKRLRIHPLKTLHHHHHRNT
ncbi:hypothetical protein L484_001455 [Morus notabilis]|uniref:Uncharacterized protein n=1 Tax=Morus notabilis TaxID=981085 RepID=W9S260_9ROSA|nr:hypothetical protein L484_001455 [Morus notabilis]